MKIDFEDARWMGLIPEHVQWWVLFSSALTIGFCFLRVTWIALR
jgi:hypothetical protein